MKIIKHLLLRLLLLITPLLGWYYWSEAAFRANKLKEHPTDVGLGMMFLLVFILFFLFVGFAIDFILKLRSKQYKIAWIDLSFIILLLLSVFYFGQLF